MDKLKQNVISYYEETLIDYYLFWYSSRDFAMHYGFSDESTKTHSDRLLEENRFLADIVKIKKTDMVLDAGCGVGGSSIWIAKNFGARVTGISISPSQVKKSKAHSREAGVSNLTEFYQMDYEVTKFRDSSFDIVWAIESFCHSPDKSKLLKEMFRILKPGGKMIVADGFQKNLAKSEEEQKDFDNFLHGFAVYKITFWDEFQKALTGAGFKNIGRWNKTISILSSSKRIFHLALFAYPLWKILAMLNLVSEKRMGNVKACLAQYKSLKKGIWMYGVYYGEK